MNEEKLHFLKKEFAPLLEQIEGEAKGNWGVMNGQQMVEHFCDAVKNASGKLILPLINTGEALEKSRAFLFSEKPFKENTKNPLIAEIPPALRKPNMKAAIEKLQEDLKYFFYVFENNPELKTRNPFYGELDYAGNVQLLYKHALHHLKQFTIE
jgi:hypothetical protein